MAERIARRVGRHIVRLRNAREQTQEQLAERAGIGRARLGQVENGVHPNLGLETLEGICLALDTTLKEFFESLPGD